MKTIKTLTASILVLITMGIFSACKKSNDKKRNCEITALTITPAGSAYVFFYNNDGKVSRTEFGNSITTYIYTDNTAIVTTLDSGKFAGKIIIRKNTDGLATNVRRENDEAGTDWTNDAYEYDGVELVRSTSTSSAMDSPTIGTYRWSNGNLVAITSGSTTTTLDYYIDKPRQNADYLYIVQQIQGFEVYRNKNLLKSISDVRFNYDFRTDGNISSVTVNSGNTTTFLDYQYQCN